MSMDASSPETFQVLPIDFGEVLADDWGYSALIAVSGYEERCIHVATQLADHWHEAWVYTYDDAGVPSFETARAYWGGVGGITPIDRSTAGTTQRIANLVETQRAAARVRGESIAASAVRIAVDVSSMDRALLASVIRAVFAASSAGLIVDFLYADGRFENALAGSEGTVLVNAPLEGFTGWTTDPSAPLLAIIGAGFEGTLALAAMETLEPSTTLMVLPDGFDDRFDREVERRNAPFVASLASEPQHYSVAHPYRLFRDLRATVTYYRGTHRVVLVPLGPKVFALASLLVASEFEDVTVWRVSADIMREPQNRLPSGPIVGLRLKFSDGVGR